MTQRRRSRIYNTRYSTILQYCTVHTTRIILTLAHPSVFKSTRYVLIVARCAVLLVASSPPRPTKTTRELVVLAAAPISVGTMTNCNYYKPCKNVLLEHSSRRSVVRRHGGGDDGDSDSSSKTTNRRRRLSAIAATSSASDVVVGIAYGGDVAVPIDFTRTQIAPTNGNETTRRLVR